MREHIFCFVFEGGTAKKEAWGPLLWRFDANHHIHRVINLRISLMSLNHHFSNTLVQKYLKMLRIKLQIWTSIALKVLIIVMFHVSLDSNYKKWQSLVAKSLLHLRWALMLLILTYTFLYYCKLLENSIKQQETN